MKCHTQDGKHMNQVQCFWMVKTNSLTVCVCACDARMRVCLPVFGGRDRLQPPVTLNTNKAKCCLGYFSLIAAHGSFVKKWTLHLTLWPRLPCSCFFSLTMKYFISSPAPAHPLHPLKDISTNPSWSLSFEASFKGTSKAPRVQTHGWHTLFISTVFQYFMNLIRLSVCIDCNILSWRAYSQHLENMLRHIT